MMRPNGFMGTLVRNNMIIKVARDKGYQPSKLSKTRITVNKDFHE